MNRDYKHKSLNEWEQWDHEAWFHDHKQTMNTDKISSELYHDLLELLDIPNNFEREGVAVAYLEDGESIDLDPEKENDGLYHVYATEEDGDCLNACSFEDQATARKFVDALILLGKADELAGGNV